jgi:hypothetical protein
MPAMPSEREKPTVKNRHTRPSGDAEYDYYGLQTTYAKPQQLFFSRYQSHESLNYRLQAINRRNVQQCCLPFRCRLQTVLLTRKSFIRHLPQPLLPSLFICCCCHSFLLCRATRKVIHFWLHTAAVLLICGALAAVFQSHWLSLPAPKADLYSAHAIAGLLVCVAVLLQYLLASWVFCYPGGSPMSRHALSPYHMAVGICIYVCGLAVCLVSLPLCAKRQLQIVALANT